MPSIIFLSFSVDGSFILWSTEETFSIYSIQMKSIVFQESSLGGMRLFRNFGDSAALLLVPSGDRPGINFSPRRPKFWNLHTKQVIREFSLDTAVEQLYWSRDYVAFVIEQQILVHDLKNFRVKLSLQRNPNTIACALGQSSNFFACASPLDGTVDIYGIAEGRLLSKVVAHRSAVSLIVFNADSTLMATFSSNGTIIRVFKVPSGELIHSFRVRRVPVVLHSLAFCPRSQFLAAHTQAGRVYIFSLTPMEPIVFEEDSNIHEEDQSIDGLSNEDSDYLKIDASAIPKQSTMSAPIGTLWSSDTTQHLLDIGMQGLAQLSSFSQAWVLGQPTKATRVEDIRLERAVMKVEVGMEMHTAMLIYRAPQDLAHSTSSTISSVSNVSEGGMNRKEEVGGSLKLLTMSTQGVLRWFDLHIDATHRSAVMEDELSYLH